MCIISPWNVTFYIIMYGESILYIWFFWLVLICLVFWISLHQWLHNITRYESKDTPPISSLIAGYLITHLSLNPFLLFKYFFLSSDGVEVPATFVAVSESIQRIVQVGHKKLKIWIFNTLVRLSWNNVYIQLCDFIKQFNKYLNGQYISLSVQLQ